MTRSELIKQLSERFPQLGARDVEYAVRLLLNTMAKAIVRDQRIEVRGFGSFNLIHRPARISRNPRTGERVNVPAKRALRFRPGKELRQRVDRKD